MHAIDLRAVGIGLERYTCTAHNAPQLHSKRLDRPGGTAAAEEVVVPAQDASVEGHGEGDRRPVVGVSWNPATSCLLKLLVGTAGDDLDTLDIDEMLNCFFE